MQASRQLQSFSYIWLVFDAALKEVRSKKLVSVVKEPIVLR